MLEETHLISELAHLHSMFVFFPFSSSVCVSTLFNLANCFMSVFMFYVCGLVAHFGVIKVKRQKDKIKLNGMER